MSEKREDNILKRSAGFFYLDTSGMIATAAFLICAVTGIFLAVPFDIANPFNSVASIIISNPAASFSRNLHYWSAQLFFIFSVIHIYDHIKRGTEKKVRKKVWLRLIISISFIFYVMLSGFILKGDADSMQARRIFDTILTNIPLVGEYISISFLGTGDDLQLVYVHHIATTTIFLFIIILEHSKIIWTSGKTFTITLVITALLSYMYTPSLNDELVPVIKGPWYFLGLQEILHWITEPLVIIVVTLAFFTVMYYIKFLGNRRSAAAKKSILYISLFYIGLTLFAWLFRGENWNFVLPWNNPSITDIKPARFSFESEEVKNKVLAGIPEVNGKPEGCLVCHVDVRGFTPSHDPAALGCYSCHAGDPYTVNREQAHKGMILIPGNLETAERSCGLTDCHGEIVGRVNKNIMTTLSGMVSVNKYTFGEIDKPGGFFRIGEIGHTPAESHLRNLCASCHIGNEKKEYGPVSQVSRGGGCTACHLNYSAEAETELNSLGKNINSLTKFHPELSINIDDDHCFGCHSRSGRISANYRGLMETRLTPEDVHEPLVYETLEDDRVFKKTTADLHHEAGMKCIDCHPSTEVMGDGTLYRHKEDQVKITCEDCHLTGEAVTKTFAELDNEQRKIVELRNIEAVNRKFLVMENTGTAIINTFLKEDSTFLQPKGMEKILALSRPADVCLSKKGHKDLSCVSCHNSWTPQCVGCHTEYIPGAEGYDLLANKEISGEWVEHIGDFYEDPPVLGMFENDGKQMVYPFMPGMILTIDESKFPGGEKDEIFKRLYSPAFSHTITGKGRSCKSCHNDPLALGYGRGEMKYSIYNGIGEWTFEPLYANLRDGLPADAWIGFLSAEKGKATRVNAKSFTLEQQKKILTVGACLTCHDENGELMKFSIDNFEKMLRRLSPECILPEYTKN